MLRSALLVVFSPSGHRALSPNKHPAAVGAALASRTRSPSGVVLSVHLLSENKVWTGCGNASNRLSACRAYLRVCADVHLLTGDRRRNFLGHALLTSHAVCASAQAKIITWVFAAGNGLRSQLRLTARRSSYGPALPHYAPTCVSRLPSLPTPTVLPTLLTRHRVGPSACVKEKQ